MLAARGGRAGADGKSTQRMRQQPVLQGRTEGLRSAFPGIRAGADQLKESSNLLMVRFRSLSVRRRPSILLIECKTVVWCLPPNWRPISGSEAEVSCFTRYMAIWRGKAMALEFERTFNS